MGKTCRCVVTPTPDVYRAFAFNEARGHSPTYERLAQAVAGNERLTDLIDQLPGNKRQPNLLFAAARSLGAPLHPVDAFIEWAILRWADVAELCRTRLTQTNEVRRLATLMPILAKIPGPLALVEVGASAGLCLFPDRWQYRYGDAIVGDPAHPVLTCEPVGPFAPPTAIPEVIWRAGIDLNPLDVTDPEDVGWLENLIWPEQSDRVRSLHSAVEIAQAEPPLLVAGDLNERLHDLASEAPRDATLVIFHSAVLAYLRTHERTKFVHQVHTTPGHWISNEGPQVIPGIGDLAPGRHATTGSPFLMALDGRPVAWSGPHGQSIEMLPEATTV